jgi:hypothetical protein
MNYKIGDRVFYYSGGVVREVLVDEKESDIKNGCPGFGGTVLNDPDKGMSVWGYDSQIERVIGA